MGIAGGSGSGKSTVLEQIVGNVGVDHIAVLDHDSYYTDLSHLPLEQREGVNFDHPEALDTQLLCEHIDGLLNSFGSRRHPPWSRVR
jgi:uridine kinase